MWRWSGTAHEGRRPPLHGLGPAETLRPECPPLKGALCVEAAAAVPTTEPPVIVPPISEARLKAAAFASDLGPDALDVSGYPAQQRYNYEVYARACSRCHTLARSVNAPPAGRTWWRFYVMSMRVRADISGQTISGKDRKAVLDFIDYDEKQRKSCLEFERFYAELERRFDGVMDKRIEEFFRVQQSSGAPRVLRR